MISLTSGACADDDRLCTYVYDTTHNQWLADAANWLIAKPLAILGLLAVAFVGRFLIGKLVDRLAYRAAHGLVGDSAVRGKIGHIRKATPDGPPPSAVATVRRLQRAQTVAGVIKSVTSFVIFSVVTIMIIAELGYDVAPLIAGAGIIGVALGFGAQNLVKDFLSGIFIAFEDQFGVGDVINVNEVTGTVEAVTLRITRLRADDGAVWYVRNGEILKVGNLSQR